MIRVVKNDLKSTHTNLTKSDQSPQRPWKCKLQIKPIRGLFICHNNQLKSVAAHVKILLLASPLHREPTCAIFPAILDPTKALKLLTTLGNFWGPGAILRDFSGPSGANKGPKGRPLSKGPLSWTDVPQTGIWNVWFCDFYELSGQGGGPPPKSPSWTDVPLDRPVPSGH